MSLHDFLLMRHELLLTLVALVVLFVEIVRNEDSTKLIRRVTLGIFGLYTLVGFLPVAEGGLFGGMYVTSSLHVLVKNILNIGIFLVLLQADGWLKQPEHSKHIGEFYLLLFSTLVGMNFMISAGNFLMFYLGLELASIPAAALAAYEKSKKESAEAGVKFIMLSALSSGVLLYGLSMIYGTVGTMYFSEITAAMTGSPLQVLALIFFFGGMSFKISLVPFHLWTADVYQGAPTGVTAYLSVVSKGASTFIFMIILFTVFSKIMNLWQDVIYVLTVATITLGNLFAMRQENLKRFFAFSSISQAGFLLLGIIAGNQLGMTAVIYYILVYIVSNLAIFGVIASIENQTGKLQMSDYNGLYHTNPRLSLLMTLGLFSLAGIPPMAGFFGKFFLFAAAAKEGFYILVLIAVLNTIISLYYYLLIVKAMFINRSDSPIAYFKSDASSRVSLTICLVGLVVIGFYASIYAYMHGLSFGVL